MYGIGHVDCRERDVRFTVFPTCRCGPLCNAVHMLTVAAVLSVTCYAYVVRARLLPYSRGAMEACVTRVTVRKPGVI